jgi:hypothetical protein
MYSGVLMYGIYGNAGLLATTGLVHPLADRSSIKFIFSKSNRESWSICCRLSTFHRELTRFLYTALKLSPRSQVSPVFPVTLGVVLYFIPRFNAKSFKQS